jgi:tRNA threonylcarbamoyladenosine biosynthesis protein TsaE
MTFPLTHASLSSEDTESLGEELARSILNDNTLPRFVALFGDLGVGKTAFVRGFTRAIAPTARVKSPTFALVNEYKGERCSVFHFDMYRIEDDDELYSIGFYDYADRNGICLTEWSENIEFALPDSYIRVEIIKDDVLNTDSRRIELTGVGF